MPRHGTPQRSGALLAQVSGALAKGNHSAASLCQVEQSPCEEGAKGSREFATRKVALT